MPTENIIDKIETLNRYSFSRDPRKTITKYTRLIIIFLFFGIYSIYKYDYKNIFLFILSIIENIRDEKQISIAIVAWLISILTLILNNRKANEREARKEMRADIDFIIRSMEEVVAINKKIRADDEYREKFESYIGEISHKISRVTTKVDHMTLNPIKEFFSFSRDGIKEYNTMRKVNEMIGEIYDITTSGMSDYEKKHDAELFIKIKLFKIIDTLELLFNKKYKNQRFS